jgi:hypothetical protein
MTKQGPEKERGLGPFLLFGIALVVGAAWALFDGLEYYNTPTFTSAAAPTLIGVAVAVVLFLLLGTRSPTNE